MFARPTLVPSARPAFAIDPAPAADAHLIPAAAMQAFARGMNITLAAALVRRGEKQSSVPVRRLSRAAATLLVESSIKHRRCA